jgi:hypothetical protein
MHALEITTFLDERISELTKERLPEEPNYPSGQTQYASFMMSRNEGMSVQDKSPDKEKWETYSRPNGSWDGPKTKSDRPANGTKNGCVPPTCETLTSRNETNPRDLPET